MPSSVLKQTNGKAPQTSHVLWPMPGSNSATVFVIIPVDDVVSALNLPVATVVSQHLFGTLLFRWTAGDPVNHLLALFAALFVDGLTLDHEYLCHMGKVEVSVQGCGYPDFAGLNAAVLSLSTLDKVRCSHGFGLKVKTNILQQVLLVSLDGEVVVGVTLFNKITSNGALG